MLPVHVFILHLDENEIAKRSLHPERSTAWQKFQQQIVENHTFCDRLEIQQKLILDAARRQRIPYSVIKVFYEPEAGDGHVRISEASNIVRGGVRINAAVQESPGQTTPSSAEFVVRLIKHSSNRIMGSVFWREGEKH